MSVGALEYALRMPLIRPPQMRRERPPRPAPVPWDFYPGGRWARPPYNGRAAGGWPFDIASPRPASRA